MIFPKELVQIAENFIANPPTTGVELNELMKLHLRMSMALGLHATMAGIPRKQIESEIELCEALWVTIEKCLMQDLSNDDEEDDDDDGLLMPMAFRAPVPRKAFFVEGNNTIH